MRIVIGLGGNCGDVPACFAAARCALAAYGDVIGVSSLWRTAPLGPAQDDFLNAALTLATPLAPRALLSACHEIERAAGRNRSTEIRWGPRPLDLDLLLVEDLVVVAPDLTLPHPRLTERRFALAPADEVASGWVHPRLGRTIGELAASAVVAAQRCVRVAGFPRA